MHALVTQKLTSPCSMNLIYFGRNLASSMLCKMKEKMLYFLKNQHLSYPMPIFTLRHWSFMLITVLFNPWTKAFIQLFSLVFDSITANSRETETSILIHNFAFRPKKVKSFQIALATVDLKLSMC